VYLARELKHDRLVAMKVLHPALVSSLQGERFLREVGILAGLAHPHILPLLDSGRVGDVLYFTMPYVEGETLRERLYTAGRLSVDETVQLVREAASALGYAHRRGLVHRDIKPENILLAENHALVADFGIARAMSRAVDERLTSGLPPGTPHYMSPEQAGGSEEVGPRSDIYSLGCVLFELLTGKRHPVRHIAFADEGIGSGRKSCLVAGIQMADEDNDNRGRTNCPQLNQGLAGVFRD
jgi:serine/threonine-protein kinase